MTVRRARASELRAGQIYQKHRTYSDMGRAGRRHRAIEVSKRGRKIFIRYEYEVVTESGTSFRRQVIVPGEVLDCRSVVWIHEEE